MKIKTPNTYYINNDYTNVYEKFMKSTSKSELAVNITSVERQKKLVSQKIR